MSNVQANVPLVNTKFVDASGNITESWFLFLIQLWRRTGGTSPPATSITIDDVLALEETFGVAAPSSLDVRNLAMTNEMTVAPVAPTVSASVDMIFPPIAPQITNETFVGGVDYTAGTTTVLTLKESFASSVRLLVFFDAGFQGDDQYSLSGTSLTFTSAIPVGTQKVYVKGFR